MMMGTEHIMDGNNRGNVKAGDRVLIVTKQDQQSGKLTEGVIKDILTSSPSHPHGIKVRLTSGVVGRVKQILPKDSRSR
jgi:uncharacterized repeat protein (TIGR03833 family)